MTDLLSTISEISAFKRREHEFEYDTEKRIAQRKSEPHHVYINGNVWKKQGQPVEFNSHAHATAAGQSVLRRDPSKHVSVAHYSYFDKHGGTDHTYARTTTEEVDADVQESFHDDFLKMVQKTHPSARLTTGAEKKKEGEELMRKRIASGVKPVYPRPEKTYPLGGYDPVSNRSYSEEVEPKQKHRVSVTLSDPNHPAVSKRDERFEKFIRVVSPSKEQALDRARKHYSKQGYKVHGVDHVGVVTEEIEQLDEIGDTPAGKRALRAVQNRAADTMSDPSKTSKQVNKAVGAGVSAGNRLHGFGHDRMKKNTVMGRDALRKQLGVKEEAEQIDEVDDKRPGWMLRADPKLAAKLRAKQKLAKARQAAYGNPEAGKSMKEDVELDEAVSVHHDRYLRSHGKKASGHGTWMFTHKRSGDADIGNDKEVHQARGTFSDAAKSAQKWAKSQGHSAVYVMEDAQLDEANDDILDVKSTYQKIAIKHLKDSSRKDATPAQKMYATKMMKRALEASKMDDHTAALNHYRGMSEDVALDEVLTKSDSASTWIRDFIKSKSSRLAGDTKKQRIKRALGAYYAKQQENLDAAYTTINVGK